MKWVTRERPKIDRIACPWLITRFIDDAPEFLYVPANQVHRVAEATGGIPYDVSGAELGHVGELCSFDAFLQKYELRKPGLARLAAIVRGADTSRLDLTPQSAGLYALSIGLSRMCPDDQDLLGHGLVLYEALYAWCEIQPPWTDNDESTTQIVGRDRPFGDVLLTPGQERAFYALSCYRKRGRTPSKTLIDPFHTAAVARSVRSSGAAPGRGV